MKDTSFEHVNINNVWIMNQIEMKNNQNNSYCGYFWDFSSPWEGF